MSQRERLEEEIRRLRELHDSLDTAWPRVRWFALGLPLSVVAGLVLGVLWFWLIAITTVLFLATSAYLIRVRRKEYQNEIRLVHADIRRIERTPNV